MQEIVSEKSLSWIKHLARQKMFTAPGASYDDLTQEGVIGLLQAAQNYDDTKGAQLATYSSIRANGNMQDFVRKHNTNNSRFISASDSQVLDAAVDVNAEVLSDIANQEIQALLIKTFFGLSAVHRKVLLLYYQQGYKQQEIAAQMQLTAARVSQLLHAAISKLQRAT
ncbi:MAG: hypothetical protein COC15_02255 [Legionellales bacterium]|nr:MAG: hypothetical protein COC15_02255 [Legionellales bacterium]